MKDDILMSRSRILDSQRFQEVAECEDMSILSDYNLKLMTPLVDRYSPFAYSVAEYIHSDVMKHSGYERSYRECLNHCYILHGL